MVLEENPQALRKARHEHEEELKVHRIVANEQLERQKRDLNIQWALKASQEVQKAKDQKEKVSRWILDCNPGVLPRAAARFSCHIQNISSHFGHLLPRSLFYSYWRPLKY